MDRKFYLGLAVIGLILPYSQFIPFLLENGLDLALIINQITAYRLTAFAWLDILVTAIVVIVMIFEERDNLRNLWIPIAATLLIGPSCGLPLFLFLRDN